MYVTPLPVACAFLAARKAHTAVAALTCGIGGRAKGECCNEGMPFAYADPTPGKQK